MYDFSVAIVNGSRFFEGSYTSAVNLYEMISNRVRVVNWYQCVDPVDKEFHHSLGTSVSGVNFPFRYLQLGLNRLFIFPGELRHLQEDVVILTDPTLFSISKGLKKYIVVKFTDLRPLTEYSDNFLTMLMFRYQLRKIGKAGQIIVTTELTKKKILNYYKNGARVTVIPESVKTADFDFNEIVNSRVKRLQEREIVKIIYIAQDRNYKNINFYIDIVNHFNQMKSGRKFEFSLVSNLKDSTRKRIERIGLPNLNVLNKIEDLSSLYVDSDLLLYPSLYEGFGMPVIEAMSFGLPVIHSNVPALIENTDGNAVLVNDFNVGAWTESILKVVLDPIKYKYYVNLSLQRSAEFTNRKVQSNVNTFLDRVSSDVSKVGNNIENGRVV